MTKALLSIMIEMTGKEEEELPSVSLGMGTQSVNMHWCFQQ